MEFKTDLDYDNIDYEKLGFKCGLEIHQQLITEKKLFCGCPAGRYSKKHDATILRHMRPTLSELGEYDGTALMEFKTKKEVIYLLNRESVCTYEMDDTPPFHLNQEALDIALEIALLLKCSIVGEVHIIRKQYLDGSIPAGFQRTSIVGIDGKIRHKNGKDVGIIQLAVEEDACREVSDIGHRIVFRTDRLSIPLVEVVTHPDMKTPKEAVEVAQNIRRLLRVTGKVKRGIGAARQDVNVSITGGTRVEIKGVYRIPLIEKLVHNEAIRQYNLLKLRDILLQNGFNENRIISNRADITDILKDTRLEVIKKSYIKGGRVSAISVKGLKSIFNHPTQPGLIFADEISGRVRVIACLDDNPNVIFSDRDYDLLDSNKWNKIFERLKAENDDTVCIIWGPKVDTETAMNEIIIRIEEIFKGIPNETRQALNDGLTDFERILPGPDRMYPDTDSPLMAITDERIEKIRKHLPEDPFSREERYRKLGLPEDIIYPLSISSLKDLFDNIVNKYKVNPVLVGVTCIQTLKSLKRAGVKIQNIRDDDLEELFKLHSEGCIFKEIFIDILKKTAVQKSTGLSDVLKSIEFKVLKESELISGIDKILESYKNVHFKNSDNKHAFLMGKLMEEIKGRYDGRKISELLKSRL